MYLQLLSNICTNFSIENKKLRWLHWINTEQHGFYFSPFPKQQNKDYKIRMKVNFFSFPEIRAHNKVFLCILKQQTMITSTKQWEKKRWNLTKFLIFFFVSFSFQVTIFVLLFFRARNSQMMKEERRKRKELFNFNEKIREARKKYLSPISWLLNQPPYTTTVSSSLSNNRNNNDNTFISLSLFIYRWLLFDLILQWMANSFQH